MTVKDIKNDIVRKIVKIAIAQKYSVTIPKLESNSIFPNSMPIRIKNIDNSSFGVNIFHNLICKNNIQISKLNLSILENAIILFD